MIIIVGANEIGVNVAKRLNDAGVNVIILEANKEVGRRVSAEHSFPVVTGDATKPSVLKNVGVDKADTLVALTSSDEKNLMACLFAKKLGARKAISMVNRSENQLMFRELGIDVAIAPSLVLSHFFETAVYGYTILGKEKFETIFINVSKKAEGKGVKEVESDDAYIVSIFRENRFFKPDPETKLNKDDTIVVVGTRENCRKIALGMLG